MAYDEPESRVDPRVTREVHLLLGLSTKQNTDTHTMRKQT